MEDTSPSALGITVSSLSRKQVLEEIAPRYMAIDSATAVPFTVTNVDSEITLCSVQIHPQKPDMGMRVSQEWG